MVGWGQASLIRVSNTYLLGPSQRLTARNRDNTSNSMSEWTNLLTTYIREQLLEIALPVQWTSTEFKQVAKHSERSDPKASSERVRKFGLSCFDLPLHQSSKTYRIYLAWIFLVVSLTRAY